MENPLFYAIRSPHTRGWDFGDAMFAHTGERAGKPIKAHVLARGTGPAYGVEPTPGHARQTANRPRTQGAGLGWGDPRTQGAGLGWGVPRTQGAGLGWGDPRTQGAGLGWHAEGSRGAEDRDQRTEKQRVQRSRKRTTRTAHSNSHTKRKPTLLTRFDGAS